MAGTTTKYALPYPTGSDAISGGDDKIAALANALDAKITTLDSGTLASRPTSTSGSPGKVGRFYRINSGTRAGQVDFDTGTSWLEDAFGIPHVQTLPTSPYDGQQVVFEDVSNSIEWHLRYEASFSGSYKWKFLGGSPFYRTLASSAAYTPSGGSLLYIAYDSPVSPPLWGSYLLEWGAQIGVGTTAQAVYLGADGTGTADVDAVALGSAALTIGAVSRAQRGVISAALQFAVKCTSGTTCQINRPWLKATPAYVG